MELNTSSIGDEVEKSLTLVGNDETEEVVLWCDDVGNDSKNAWLMSCTINKFTLDSHLDNLQWTNLCYKVVYTLIDRLMIY